MRLTKKKIRYGLTWSVGEFSKKAKPFCNLSAEHESFNSSLFFQARGIEEWSPSGHA